MGLVYNATEGKEQYLVFLDNDGNGGGGGSTSTITLLSITTAPTGTFEKGSKYYNSTTKLIYTATADDVWGTDGETPKFNTIYIYDNNGTTEYYQWDGDNLVETDLERYQLKSNITNSFDSSSQTTYPSSKALKDGLDTAKPNIYDIKLLSQAIADKGWSCLSHTTRKDISKDDVPTVFTDILDKYNNCDKAELPWTNGVSADGYIGEHNGTIYRMSGSTISYSSNPKTVNFTNLVTISGINYVNDFTFRCYNNYMLVFYGDSYDDTCSGIIVVSYDGTYFNIDLSTKYYVSFEKEDYIYITDYTNRRLYRLPNTHYNNLPQSLELVVEYTDNYQICTDFVYHNGLYYIVNSLYQIYPLNPTYTVIGVHTTTDLSDLSKYNWNKYHTTITSTGYGYEAKIVKAGNRLIVMAYGNNSYSCSYSDDGFDTGTDFTFGGVNRNYWLTLKDNILFFTYLESYKKGGGSATFYKEHIITFNTINMSYVDTDFGEKTNNANICKLVYTDNNYVIVGNNIKYSGLAPVQYSDVINGTTIYYYKFDDWKICIAGENGTNDVNLDTVYGYLGYLNYWRLDLTEGSETVSLPRNSNLWTMMYVGDDYQNSNLPSGEFKSLQTKNLTFINVVADNWVADNTYADYGYKCEITLNGIITNSVATVIFAPTEADSGNYATVCQTGANTVTIYSKVNTTITIPTIVAMEA